MNKENKQQTEKVLQEVEQKDSTPTLSSKTTAGVEISEGLNLMPKMSEEEVSIEKAKSSVNIGSVLSLIVLVLVSIAVVGFNIVSKQSLNTKKKELAILENKINQQVDNLLANEEIVDRAVLYANVKKGAFSHKQIIEFLNSVGVKVGSIEMRSVMISEKLGFTYTGYAPSLEHVSKLWYILGTDPNINYVNLESVGKGENNVSFTFEGVLNGKNFFNR